MTRALLALLVLAGCTACAVPVDKFNDMTPEQCRMYGVAVHDNDTPTGIVVVSECGTYMKMERECGEIYGQTVDGCAKAAGVDHPSWPAADHKYEIYYADCGPPGSCIAYHESCHARYETKAHTVNFNLRAMQGDKLAACP